MSACVSNFVKMSTCVSNPDILSAHVNNLFPFAKVHFTIVPSGDIQLIRSKKFENEMEMK